MNRKITMQTRLESLIESISNTAVGYVIALISQLLIYPLYGIHVSLGANMSIVAWFTLISIARSYLTRRWFNRKSEITNGTTA